MPPFCAYTSLHVRKHCMIVRPAKSNTEKNMLETSQAMSSTRKAGTNGY